MMPRSFLFAAAIMLSACSATQAPPATVAATPPIADTAPVEVPENQILQDQTQTTPGVDFAMIEGETPAGVQAYLGQPSLVRRDENVQIMIFETDTCVFQVTFYEPPNGDHFRAEHTDARNRKGYAYDAELCVQQLLDTKR